MTQSPRTEKTLRGSATGQEPVEIQLESTESLTTRVEAQSATCSSRPGSNRSLTGGAIRRQDGSRSFPVETSFGGSTEVNPAHVSAGML